MESYIKESYRTDKYPNAKQLRDKRAKELRALGYKVKTMKWDFTDIARCTLYQLEAEKA